MVKFDKYKKKKFFAKGMFGTFIFGGLLILIIFLILKKFCAKGKKDQNKIDKNTSNDSNDSVKKESREQPYESSSSNSNFKKSDKILKEDANKEIIENLKLVKLITKEMKKMQ